MNYMYINLEMHSLEVGYYLVFVESIPVLE